MKAVIISKTGGPEVLEIKDIKLEDPKSSEVLIKNEAIGLNYIDTYHRSGLYPVELPSNIGMEGAGTIEKIGPDVKDFQVGDTVKINHKKVDPKAQFRIEKIMSKNIKVMALDGSKSMIKVSPGLLVKIS